MKKNKYKTEKVQMTRIKRSELYCDFAERDEKNLGQLIDLYKIYLSNAEKFVTSEISLFNFILTINLSLFALIGLICKYIIDLKVLNINLQYFIRIPALIGFFLDIVFGFFMIFYIAQGGQKFQILSILEERINLAKFMKAEARINNIPIFGQLITALILWVLLVLMFYYIACFSQQITKALLLI
jgi:hypothetical protein